MKKSMFVYFLIMTICLFHLLVPDVVFGQAIQVFNKYESTFKHPDVHEHFPDVLNAFKDPDKQLFLGSSAMNRFVDRPAYLRRFAPKAHDSILTLLLLNDGFQKLFRDDDFHDVVQNSNEIDALIKKIMGQTPHPRDTTRPIPPSEPVPEPRRATALEIVSGNHQSGEVGKLLAQPFIVGVLDQDRKPLEGTAVTFTVTAGPGRLSGQIERTIVTNVYGQARTTLTLGSRAGRHSVTARAAGITQTFRATAVAPPPPEEPVPVVPVPPSTEEPPMYWIEGNTIYYRPTGGGKETFHAPQSGTLTGGLAVDMGGGKVYWTEQTIDNMGHIQSADLDGKDVQAFKPLYAAPNHIAFDAETRRLYWTNDVGRIQRIKVGGGRVENFEENLKDPNHIAFDVKARRLYWTVADGIYSIYADNDTGIPRRLDTGDLGEVRGIAVFNEVVYWTEQTGSGGKVRSMHRTGKDDKLLDVAVPDVAVLKEIIPGGITVDPVGGKVYWTTSHGIQSALLTGETVDILEETPAGIALGGMTRVPAAPAAPSLSPAVSVENTLLANYPNPFNPETWIPYQLSASADVSVSIYAVDGCLVRRLDLGHQVEGVYRSRSRAAYWDGRNEFGERVASGLYFYTLTAGDFTATRKMLIRK